MPEGDLTSKLLISETEQAEAEIIAKEDGVLACSWLGQAVLDELALIYRYGLNSYSENPNFCTKPENLVVEGVRNEIVFKLSDSDVFSKGTCLARLKGSAQILLTAERTLLNFLQRLCGVAAVTRKLVNLVKDYPAVRLLDTRKTMPGLRVLEKEAFKAGGGTNHRMNLSDMILIKENHLSFYRKSSPGKNLADAIKHARSTFERPSASLRAAQPTRLIECEINADFLREPSRLQELLGAEPDIIMLDNFSPQEAKDLVNLIKKLRADLNIERNIKIEASGGINEHNIVDYAKTGVDFISTGSVFTQAKNIDLSMLLI